MFTVRQRAAVAGCASRLTRPTIYSSAISRRFSEVSVAFTATRSVPSISVAFELAQMQIADPKTLHQKRADLRLLGRAAGDGHDIGRFDFRGFQRLAVDQSDQRPQHEVDAGDEPGGEDGAAPMAGADQQSNRAGTPKSRRRVQAAHVDAFLPNHPGAKKAYAGDDLGCDPRRTVSVNWLSNTTKIAAPSETSVLVRNPARRWRHCRSKPIAPPSRTAMIRLRAWFSGTRDRISASILFDSEPFARRSYQGKIPGTEEHRARNRLWPMGGRDAATPRELVKQIRLK